MSRGFFSNLDFTWRPQSARALGVYCVLGCFLTAIDFQMRMYVWPSVHLRSILFSVSLCREHIHERNESVSSKHGGA